MSRTSRVPYHQNVYDLLLLEPRECPEAARMIAEHETAHAQLPGSVREWYTVPNIVPLAEKVGVRTWRLRPGTIWYTFSNQDQVPTLSRVLNRFVDRTSPVTNRFVQFLCENQGVVRWWFERTPADDPPVWVDNDVPEDPNSWAIESERFTEFVFKWFSSYGFVSNNPQVIEPEVAELLGVKPEQLASHLNGLWLRTPADPFEPAAIDYLTEAFDEPERTPRPGNVTTYTFRPPGGTVRVTADEPGLGGALSAWWVHAETPERLAELGRIISPFGTLRETLRADTEPARAMLNALRGSSGK